MQSNIKTWVRKESRTHLGLRPESWPNFVSNWVLITSAALILTFSLINWEIGNGWKYQVKAFVQANDNSNDFWNLNQ